MKNVQDFLRKQYPTRTGEVILLSFRPHLFTIFPSLLFTTLLLVGVIAGTSLLFLHVFSSLLFLLLSVIMSLLGGAMLYGIIIMQWYCHVYFLTNKKIGEYRSFPLFWRTTNGVLLDQVRCTEIDVSRNGLIHELFDLGDITLTFDRPTRQEEFTMHNIPSPEKFGIQLEERLNASTSLPSFTTWRKDPVTHRYSLLVEDIFPSTRNAAFV